MKCPKCQSIIKKINISSSDFSADELTLIKNITENELLMIQNELKENKV